VPVGPCYVDLPSDGAARVSDPKGGTHLYPPPIEEPA
jgi:hypothetical protein